MSAENKAKARRICEESWNKGNLAVFDELCTSDFVYHDPAQPHVRSREDYRQLVSETRSEHPDMHVTIEDLFAEGDRVAARGAMSGTRKEGEYHGIHVSGKKRATWTWTSVFRFAGGKIAELWTNYDALGLLVQVGVISVPR
jgi:steroid delta-isomerase-like uncharacterized protein